MANPFEGKFKAFSASLTAQTTAANVATTAQEANAVFQDKPFSVEYRPLYSLARVGRALAQVVTYMATAGIGMFVLLQVAPTGVVGYVIAVPLALLFAYGVEAVKWRSLAIAAKQVLKYKTLGAAGIVAALAVCVSVVFALFGASELPGIIHPEPTRAQANGAQVETLTADIERVQTDIERLRAAPGWTAQNRTLPRLMRERAALVEKRTDAVQAAQGVADTEHAEKVAQRAENVQRMRSYCIIAAAVGELLFLLCGVWILYYLFRQFAETAGKEPEQEAAAAAAPRYAMNLTTPTATKIVNETKTATCEHCGNGYLSNHKKQKYCCDACRVASWEQRTGKTLQKKVAL
jgi:hypothetical protein